MIKYSEIGEMLKPLNIRVEEFSIKNEEEEIEPYFLVYAHSDTQSIYADGINYCDIAIVKAYLEVDDLKSEVVKQLETILTENGCAFDKSIEYIPDNRMYELLYEFETYYE